ncbi:MAG TPA: TauD/TfdA family dioxygenase [bacterium]|nr:TauD/TfdA family dioxygenase [bacterium]
MELKTRPLHPRFGMEVLGVDLTALDEETHQAILRLWQEHPLLLIRRQLLSEEDLMRFSRFFGRLEQVVRKDIHSRHNPEVVIISNLRDEQGAPLGGLGSYDLRWHTDQSYRIHPATGAVFYALEVPPSGGNTWYANTQLAYEALPASLQQELQGLQGLFAYTLYDEDIKDSTGAKVLRELTPDAIHPMVLTHPVTGKRSLYLDPSQTFGIQGMEAGRAQALLRELKAHAVRPEFVYQHHWRLGDVMMWDNARLLHRRDPYDARLPRFMKRTTIFMNPEWFPVPSPLASSGESSGQGDPTP